MKGLGRLRSALPRWLQRKQEEQALDQLNGADLLAQLSRPRRKTAHQMRARRKAMEGRRVHRAQLIAARKR